MNDEAPDSMAVRLEIVRRIEAGEITLEQGQREIRRIKRRAKGDGVATYHENRARLGP